MSSILVRPYVPSTDHNFILSTWLKSYRDANFCKGVPSEIYYKEHGRIVEWLLANHSTLIAVDPEAPNVIWGWVNGTSKTLNYVYVKHAFRKMGVAKTLILHANVEQPYLVTHLTPLVQQDNIIYSPYLLGRL